MNHNNGFSLPKLQELCDDAYVLRSIIEHIVMENNCDWNAFMKDLVLPKEQFNAGISTVRIFNLFYFSSCFPHIEYVSFFAVALFYY